MSVTRIPNTVTEEMKAALVCSHGPFVWGKSALEAVENAVVLEEIAFMAWQNLAVDSDIPDISRKLGDKHFYRKHGDFAYYGQLDHGQAD